MDPCWVGKAGEKRRIERDWLAKWKLDGWAICDPPEATAAPVVPTVQADELVELARGTERTKCTKDQLELFARRGWKPAAGEPAPAHEKGDGDAVRGALDRQHGGAQDDGPPREPEVGAVVAEAPRVFRQARGLGRGGQPVGR